MAATVDDGHSNVQDLSFEDEDYCDEDGLLETEMSLPGNKSGRRGQFLRKKSRGDNTEPLSLMEGEGRSLNVLGFNQNQRAAFLQILMSIDQYCTGHPYIYAAASAVQKSILLHICSGLGYSHAHACVLAWTLQVGPKLLTSVFILCLSQFCLILVLDRFLTPSMHSVIFFAPMFGKHALIIWSMAGYVIPLIPSLTYAVYMGGFFVQFLIEKMGMIGSLPQPYGYFVPDIIVAAAIGVVMGCCVGPSIHIVGQRLAPSSIIQCLLQVIVLSLALSSQFFLYMLLHQRGSCFSKHL